MGAWIGEGAATLLAVDIRLLVLEGGRWWGDLELLAKACLLGLDAGAELPKGLVLLAVASRLRELLLLIELLLLLLLLLLPHLAHLN